MITDRESSSGTSAAVVGGIVKRFATVVVFLVFNAVLLFASAGRVDWIWAWVFLAICLVSMAINGTIMLRTSPETLAERGRPGETEGWDKIVAGLWALCLFLIVPLLAGLDARFSWTGRITPVWNVAGALALAGGLALAAWAMIENAFFSTAVRIQLDRGHTVCRSGPYRLVRHPGYAGFILQSIGTPIILGSLVSIVPAVAAVVLMVIRTSLEDRKLQLELPGYRDFAQEVKYRLLPGVW
jgi:protein-S-isoprenylcysteine O-methyltransferase Ste14